MADNSVYRYAIWNDDFCNASAGCVFSVAKFVHDDFAPRYRPWTVVAFWYGKDLSPVDGILGVRKYFSEQEAVLRAAASGLELWRLSDVARRGLNSLGECVGDEEFERRLA